MQKWIDKQLYIKIEIVQLEIMNTCYTYIYFLRIFQFKKKKKKNETRHTILIVINFLEKRLID